ncbi:MAG: NAD(P)/FAD-dependent oxidoreductase, partial [Syntrophales bacterium]|nr:NAD(P)/FAD-dependent oxidoreductase [Syntrophales bacterium]
MQDLFDVVIIGAGVVGLAVAEALTGENRRVVVVEKNDSFGQETSSRNSEVIHAGIYYRKDFLKSRLCLSGNRMIYEWCRLKNIPHKRIGKLIVATNDDECADLEKIISTAKDNGVEGLALLGRSQVRTMEPSVAALAAIFSPNTGIIDSHSLMQSLLYSAEQKGAIITYRAKVTGIELDHDAYELTMNGGEYRVRTKILINGAGLHADHIAALAGIDIDARGYRIKPCKGNYFTSTPSPRLNHLVYP